MNSRLIQCNKRLVRSSQLNVNLQSSTIKRISGFNVHTLRNYVPKSRVISFEGQQHTYFEKFRTDGVEYDLFTGQSISPEIPFTKQHLAAIRAIQLDYMIRATLVNRQLIPGLPVVLQTTQLLLANPGNIDITFREDEKRFDVEGPYDIRYQILKKRIEKYIVKDSTERLTLPDTIALVYVMDEDLKEYLPLLDKEMEKNRVSKIEYLELENMQGVNGVKALRIYVK